MFYDFIKVLTRKNIHVIHEQYIYIVPTAFRVKSGEPEITHILCNKTEDQIKRIAKRLKDNQFSVDAYCDVYYADTDELIGQDQKFRLEYHWFSNFLLLHRTEERQKSGLIYKGDIIIIKKTDDYSLCLFMQPFEFESRTDISCLVYDTYMEGESFYQIEKLLYDNYRYESGNYYACVINNLPYCLAENPQKTPKRTKKGKIFVPNTRTGINADIKDRIKKIDESLLNGKEFSNISNSQWENTIRPEIEKIAERTLNEESKKEVHELLDTVSKNLIDKEDKECIDTEVTLSALRSFLTMNGCDGDLIRM